MMKWKVFRANVCAASAVRCVWTWLIEFFINIDSDAVHVHTMEINLKSVTISLRLPLNKQRKRKREMNKNKSILLYYMCSCIYYEANWL